MRSADSPANEGDRVGLIRYRLKGNISKRREDAYRQMHESCDGPYRIVSEGEGDSGAHGFVLSSGIVVSAPKRYWYISYQCAH